MIIRSLAITASRDWDHFVSTLRRVTLLGDETVFPYAHATIGSRLVDPDDIFPISLYVLKRQLDVQEQLHEVLLRDHQINTFDQDGGMPDITFHVEREKGEWSMAPPIVEVSKADDGKPLLLDGEHRFMLAKKLKRKIRVVWIENVPAQYPVVALPVRWQDVKVYDQVPPLAQKRMFRFKDLQHFPDISSFSRVNVTEKNFHYFFYRDLSPVCTTGIRGEGTA